MKQSYINCLKKLREFRKNLKVDKDVKRGKLYFTWIIDKTEKIENEKDEEFIYNNMIQYTLKNYKIDTYTYERLDRKLKSIVNDNYILKNNNYIFNNINITKGDVLLLMKKILFKRGNSVKLMGNI
ncbi:MAG: hypothetical protein HFJ23_01030 [Clostridia bacterium]|nr:hypothetical protein [Clostridia bacterium]